MRRAGFPFPALVGLDDLKMALQLAAIDRRLSVLIRGDKGAGKSTAACGLVDLLERGAPFVNLPIGATEDRLLGGLDVEKALKGDPALKPGLLSAAHGGVLYVDEINLLADHLVDVLLDVAASGINRIERDGISYTHPARFILVGSMNPEEGELRHQLLDRFGFCVDVRAPSDAVERSEVVRRRLAFEAHVRECAECRAEVGELRRTRQHLALWAPSEPEFNFRIVREPAALPPPRRRFVFVPQWGLAAAASIFLLAGALAIANVEIRRTSDGFVVRTGWAKDAAPQPGAVAGGGSGSASSAGRTTMPGGSG